MRRRDIMTRKLTATRGATRTVTACESPWEGDVARADEKANGVVDEGRGQTARKIIVVPCIVKSSL
jgi:hypothetical protein